MSKRSLSFVKKQPLKKQRTQKWNAAKALSSMSSLVSSRAPTVDNRAMVKYGKPTSLSMTGLRNDQKHVTMRYVDAGVLNASTTTGDIWNFRANSIFDPDQTGTGHQPYGHDTYATMWNHYTVLGSKIQIDYISDAATGSYGPPPVVCLSLNDAALGAASASGTWVQRVEAGNCAYGLAITDGVAKVHNRFKKSFVASKFFGRASPEDAAELGAAFGANPSEEAFFSIQVTSPDGGDCVTGVCLVTIDYDVLLQEPKQLATS